MSGLSKPRDSVTQRTCARPSLRAEQVHAPQQAGERELRPGQGRASLRPLPPVEFFDARWRIGAKIDCVGELSIHCDLDGKGSILISNDAYTRLARATRNTAIVPVIEIFARSAPRVAALPLQARAGESGVASTACR